VATRRNKSLESDDDMKCRAVKLAPLATFNRHQAKEAMRKYYDFSQIGDVCGWIVALK
jgi:hypothetical protein